MSENIGKAPTKGVGREVAIGPLTAAAVGLATLIWNWGSSGGLVHLLGGITPPELQKAIQDARLQTLSSPVTTTEFQDKIAELQSATKMVISGKNVCRTTYRSLGALLVGINRDYSGAWNDVLEVANYSAGIPLPGFDGKWIAAHPTICVRK